VGKKRKVIAISKDDNVGIALAEELNPGEQVCVDERAITVLDPIPVGHKMALCPIPAGGWVIKFGEIIGRASGGIRAGEHVHIHNVEDITELLSARARERGGA